MMSQVTSQWLISPYALVEPLLLRLPNPSLPLRSFSFSFGESGGVGRGVEEASSLSFSLSRPPTACPCPLPPPSAYPSSGVTLFPPLALSAGRPPLSSLGASVVTLHRALRRMLGGPLPSTRVLASVRISDVPEYRPDDCPGRTHARVLRAHTCDTRTRRRTFEEGGVGEITRATRRKQEDGEIRELPIIEKHPAASSRFPFQIFVSRKRFDASS